MALQRTRPRASCIDHLVVRPGRAAELRPLGVAMNKIQALDQAGQLLPRVE